MTQETDIMQTAAPTVYRLDREHGRLRLVIFLAFLVVWAGVFVLLGMLLPGDGLNLISVAVGFIAAYGVTALLERLLKDRWHSGRELRVDEGGVTILNRGRVQSHADAMADAHVLLWRFVIRKRARVPKGWSMLACAIEREGSIDCPVYTFVSPAQLEAYDLRERFKLLEPRRDTEKAGERQDLRLAGEQRRLRAAEEHRWMDGAEMTFDDFNAYMQQLQTRFTEWMPIN